MKFALCETKLGWVGIGVEGGKICAATLPTTRQGALERMARAGATEEANSNEDARLVDVARRAAEGEEVDVSNVVRLTGGTPFQRDVWRAVLSTPWGVTVSYGELAARLGKPGAARAVGRALAANPVPLLVPCHRVVASDGIGGFGGGLEMKRALLRQEGVTV